MSLADWFRRDQRNDTSVCSFRDLVLLLLLALVVFPLFFSFVTQLFIHSLDVYEFYVSAISLLLVVVMVGYKRSYVLTLSRWRPRMSDLAIGLSTGVLISSLRLLCVSDAAKFLAPPYVSNSSFVVVAVVGPILEELVFRGIFLRSLQARMPRVAAVCVVSVILSLVHTRFWYAIPAQLVFSCVYVSMGDSLPASITAHIASNALTYLPLATFFQKWHIYTLFRI